ncbi:MAG: hypothetical protein AB1454_13700 [Candidatus Auribacterota bacterium]
MPFTIIYISSTDSIHERTVVRLLNEKRYTTLYIAEDQKLPKNPHNYDLVIAPPQKALELSDTLWYAGIPLIADMGDESRRNDQPAMMQCVNSGICGFIYNGMAEAEIIHLIERHLHHRTIIKSVINTEPVLSRLVHELENENYRIQADLSQLSVKFNNANSLINDLFENFNYYLNSRQILYVYDAPRKDPAITFLQHKKIDVRTASCIVDALPKATFLDPALIVTEFQLVDGTASDLASSIKAHKSVLNPFIILYTASNQLLSQGTGQLSPIDEFVRKRHDETSYDELFKAIIYALYTVNKRRK